MKINTLIWFFKDKIFLKINYLYISCLFSYSIFAQQNIIDSLLTVLKNRQQEDTNKVAILNKLAIIYGYHLGDYEKAIYYAAQAKTIAQKINYKSGIADSYNLFGVIEENRGNYTEAIRNHLIALKIRETLKDELAVAGSLGNIGNVYSNQKKYTEALNYYYKALKIAEKRSNKNLIANTILNISSVYSSLSDYQKALDFYFKGLKMKEELRDKQGIAIAYAGIADCYEKQKLYSQALKEYFKSLKIAEELQNTYGKSIVIGSIGHIYLKMKNYKKAEKYILQAISLADTLKDMSQIMEWNKHISNLYYITGNYKLAIDHYEKYIAAKDSINNEENIRKQTQLEMNYEFEKKQTKEKLEREKKDAITKEQQRKQRIIIYSISAGFIIVIAFLIYVTYSLNINKKQKTIIERQKKIVEEKNKEIIDSINYAKRIQTAILPNEHKWKELLLNSFILYLPKDIVAGDFYWLEETEDYIYVAAADSTGHGVPGAMVSVICSSALTSAVLEDKKVNTNEILDKTREIVLEKLTREGEHIRDGMDVCLVRINKNNQTEIQFSGANRPLWIIDTNKELQVCEGDKQPIGLYEYAQPFTAQNIQIHQESMLYLFTDGYADQFGGKKQKKLGNKYFKEILREMSNKPTKKQVQELEQFLNEWKKDDYQIDDITVIGIKVG